MRDKAVKQIVVDADPAWAEEGLAWARTVRDALAEVGADVDHIGSTAVPGLAAKDVIDLQALVCDLDDPRVVHALSAAGFRLKPDVTADTPRPLDGEPIDPTGWRKLYFHEPQGARRMHLHVRRIGAANAALALMQRDFLRADARVRAEWEAIKRALAAHTHDTAVYAALKEPATTLLVRLARNWAEQTRWRPGACEAPAGGD